MQRYLLDAEQAFYSINPIYFNQRVLHYNSVDESRQDIERVIMTEFYHQWRIIIENNNSLYHNLILHSTIGKRLSEADPLFPDLTLHGGQIGTNRMHRNEVIVEIKMQSFDKSDVDKLLDGINNLRYRKALYMIVHSNRNQIKERIENYYRLEDIKSNSHKFYFLTMEDGLFGSSHLFI